MDFLAIFFILLLVGLLVLWVFNTVKLVLGKIKETYHLTKLGVSQIQRFKEGAADNHVLENPKTNNMSEKDVWKTLKTVILVASIIVGYVSFGIASYRIISVSVNIFGAEQVTAKIISSTACETNPERINVVIEYTLKNGNTYQGTLRDAPSDMLSILENTLEVLVNPKKPTEPIQLQASFDVVHIIVINVLSFLVFKGLSRVTNNNTDPAGVSGKIGDKSVG